MKTSTITTALILLFALPILAQDRTTVNATSSEISDNLDLRAVASIFGDSQNLEDFERRLNDPNLQISNLDLNNDNRVDYLRVVESVQDNTHLVVIQSVLGQNTYQDVATLEVERDRNNQVSVQVVGDVYMYGANYIYEPVYINTPVIYNSFWLTHYRPYVSTWYWGYYPSYYYVWSPFPVFRYRNNIHVHINFSNHYNYVNVRRSAIAVAMYQPRRSNYCEVHYPTRSFEYRNNNVSNRYELDQTRNKRNSTRNEVAYGNSGNTSVRNNNFSTRSDNEKSNINTVRNYDNGKEAPIRSNASATRYNTSNFAIRNNSIRNENPARSNANSERSFNTNRSETSVRRNSESVNYVAQPRDFTSNGSSTRIESSISNNTGNRNSQPQNATRITGNSGNNTQRAGRR